MDYEILRQVRGELGCYGSASCEDCSQKERCDERYFELAKDNENEIKIRMVKTVRPDFPLGIVGLLGEKPGTILRAGIEYSAKTNGNGAIAGLCDNGEHLGVKPGEFEFVTAPDWVLAIHINPKERMDAANGNVG